MSASSHFLIPVSSTASRARSSAPPRRPIQATDWAEFDEARRRTGLLSLLAVYAVGLALVVALYQGEDIGVLLSAFFAHALLTAVRALYAQVKECSVSTRLGTLVVNSRARLIPARRR